MPLKTATVIGATGLIGSQLVEQLQQDEQFGRIRVLVRRPAAFSQSKVEEKLVNFRDPESLKLALEGSDVVFCVVGTTQKKVQGDKDAYRKVDYDIPVHAARFCSEIGCPKFLLVSAVGANRQSNNFYLRLKGEVEDAVQQFPIESVSIFRPSILLGKRKERRPGEKIGQVVMTLFSFLLIGGLKKYKPVKASAVAAAMIREAKKEVKGRFVYEFPF